MQKEVLIHVRGLQMMDAQGDQEPIEIIVPGQYYFAMVLIISDMRNFSMKPLNLRSIT